MKSLTFKVVVLPKKMKKIKKLKFKVRAILRFLGYNGRMNLNQT